MTWVTGQSTWGTLAYDLTRVITGETPATDGTTVAAADRWVRETARTIGINVTYGSTTVPVTSGTVSSADIGSFVTAPGVIAAGTTVASITNATTFVLSVAPAASGQVDAQVHTDSIRTPASVDVPSGQMSNRTGYCASLGTANNLAANLAQPSPAVIRQTAPFTSPPPGWTRWVTRFKVTSSNTIAGQYTNCAVDVLHINLDGGTTSTSGGGSLAPSAAGVLTITGLGAQFTISDPSGIMPAGVWFLRAFLYPAYPYGVDWWPMLARASGPPTFSTPPPGVQGTDWDVLSIPTKNCIYPGETTTCNDRGSVLYGLGIKTATGLGAGNRYSVSFPMALAKARIFPSGTAGMLSLDVNGAAKEPASNTFIPAGGYTNTGWAKMFTTAGSVLPASAVEYFLSVTKDGIVAVFNGDTAVTGRMGTAYYCAFQPADPAYDVFPVTFNAYFSNLTADMNNSTAFFQAHQYPYPSLRRRQDGSEGAVRDWQTRWMRCDHMYYGSPNHSGTARTTLTAAQPATSMITGDGDNPASMVSPGLFPYGPNTAQAYTAPTRQVKPGCDGKWWLYPFVLHQGDAASASTGGMDESRMYRGVTTRFFFLPEDGWNSGDTLTDTVTGDKYFLVKPDYPGTGMCRMRVASNNYMGGIAIKEL